MPAAAHILRKNNHSRQPIILFMKPKVARICKPPGTFYRPRDHEASPFFKVVRDHFEDSKHRTCGEHDEVARRVSAWMAEMMGVYYSQTSTDFLRFDRRISTQGRGFNPTPEIWNRRIADSTPVKTGLGGGARMQPGIRYQRTMAFISELPARGCSIRPASKKLRPVPM